MQLNEDHPVPLPDLKYPHVSARVELSEILCIGMASNKVSSIMSFLYAKARS